MKEDETLGSQESVDETKEAKKMQSEQGSGTETLEQEVHEKAGLSEERAKRYSRLVDIHDEIMNSGKTRRSTFFLGKEVLLNPNNAYIKEVRPNTSSFTIEAKMYESGDTQEVTVSRHNTKELEELLDYTDTSVVPLLEQSDIFVQDGDVLIPKGGFPFSKQLSSLFDFTPFYWLFSIVFAMLITIFVSPFAPPGVFLSLMLPAAYLLIVLFSSGVFHNFLCYKISK